MHANLQSVSRRIHGKSYEVLKAREEGCMQTCGLCNVQIN